MDVILFQLFGVEAKETHIFLNQFTEAYDVYNMVWSTVKETRAERYFISILQHLLLIRNDYFIR